MFNCPFLSYGDVELLNVPHAQFIADEVLRDDCYGLKGIPDGSNIIDLGAFYGEFAIYCARVKKCHVTAVEASYVNRQVMWLNMVLNKVPDVRLVRAAVSNRCDDVAEFSHNPSHPAGSKIGSSTTARRVDTITLSKLIATIPMSLREFPVIVKMDIEGAEMEVFESVDEWSPLVSMVLMEWHNDGGAFYRDSLTHCGFAVTLKYGSHGMGYIHAQKTKPISQ